MKKALIMLPLVVCLLGCSVRYRRVSYHNVVAVPYSHSPYEWRYVCYGYPCCTLQGCFGFGWINPFCLYEFTLNHYPDWYYSNADFHPGYGNSSGQRGIYLKRTIRKDELSKGKPKARRSLPDKMSGWPEDSPGGRKGTSIQPIERDPQPSSRESVRGSSPERRVSSGNGNEKHTGRKK
jgi:hypothetical protein